MSRGLMFCPFCGDTNAHTVKLHNVRWGVTCDNAYCDVTTDPNAKTEQEAIDHWNTRATGPT